MKENKSNPLLYLLKGKVIKHLVIVTEHRLVIMKVYWQTSDKVIADAEYKQQPEQMSNEYTTHTFWDDGMSVSHLCRSKTCDLWSWQ